MTMAKRTNPYNLVGLALVSAASLVAFALFVALVLAATGADPRATAAGLVEMARPFARPLVWAAQVAALAIIMWRALPSFMARHDKQVVQLRAERDAAREKARAATEDKRELARLLAVAQDAARRGAEVERAVLAEYTRAGGNGEGVTAAEAAGWLRLMVVTLLPAQSVAEQRGAALDKAHADNARLVGRVNRAEAERDEYRDALDQFVHAEALTVQAVAAFVQAVGGSKARGVQPLAKIARATLGVSVNTNDKAVTAAIQSLAAAIPYRPDASPSADSTAGEGAEGAGEALSGALNERLNEGAE